MRHTHDEIRTSSVDDLLDMFAELVKRTSGELCSSEDWDNRMDLRKEITRRINAVKTPEQRMSELTRHYHSLLHQVSAINVIENPHKHFKEMAEVVAEYETIRREADIE